MIEKIISGGQTGADIAALDVALRHSFPHGGWCPKGRRSLDGAIPDRYRLGGEREIEIHECNKTGLRRRDVMDSPRAT